ncbi:MAG: response regulator [Candidatus Rokubacteria bacterium]|nr:response regulator [Candidatus Rokubacteria bacterium]
MPASARRRVLVIDDEETIRELLTEFLGLRGYEVRQAATAVAGLAEARERPPDVVLLDLHLPGTVSGVDALRALAQTTRVIVVSGTPDAELARTTLQLGAFDYITKPFNLGRVADLVGAAILQDGGAAS